MHNDLNNITLAQFVTNHTISINRTYKKRKQVCIIRYRNYDMSQYLNEYKREITTLHVQLRN